MSDTVLYSSADRIGVVTVNHPEARNAANRELALGREAAIDRLENDPEIWVGVLCANTEDQDRPAFCAGADPKAISETGDAGALDTRRGGFAGFVANRRVVLAAESEDDETLQLLSEELLGQMLASEDATEGLAAFIEKRSPQWKAR